VALVLSIDKAKEYGSWTLEKNPDTDQKFWAVLKQTKFSRCLLLALTLKTCVFYQCKLQMQVLPLINIIGIWESMYALNAPRILFAYILNTK
jgi:hypothetical protein